MAFRVRQLAGTNASDAQFRAWINELHNALLAFGWTQTSDTGQINFSTVTRPTNINIYQGFAVYQMADALQATTAVFMRLDFGTGGTGDTPGLGVNVGIGGTNGSGTLTGTTTGRKDLAAGPNLNFPTASLGNCRSSGNTSSFRCNFWSTVFNHVGWTLIIERDKDTSGADTTAGINVVFMGVVQGSTYTTYFSQFLASGSSGLGDSTRLYACISSAANNAAGSGNGCGLAPVHTSNGPMRNPMMGILIFSRPDFLIESTNPVTIYGSVHNYVMCRPNVAGACPINQWNSDCGFAMLME